MAFVVTHLDITVWVLAGLYFLLFFIPVVQLIRIQVRVPDLGWTTQKLFLALILLACLVRTVFFAIVPQINENGRFFMENFVHYPMFTILDTLPGILFFSAYTLLSLSFPQKLRPIFMVVNMVLYFAIIILWLLLFFLYMETYVIDIALNVFLACIYLLAASGFLIYGGRLYWMLRRFPVESRPRRSKLREVGWVTLVCTVVFTGRAVLLIYSSIATSIDTNVFFIGSYYFCVEILPSLLVLIILRKLPPKKTNVMIRSPSYQKLTNDSRASYGTMDRPAPRRLEDDF